MSATPPIDTKRLGATNLLAAAIASSSDPFSIGTAASIEEHGEHGIEAVVTMPSGDRYRVVVEWVGDRESDR